MKFRVKIAEKYNDKIIFEGGSFLYIDTTFEHQEKVAYEAVVTYVPDYVFVEGKEMPVNGEGIGVTVGDKVWIRYDVVGMSTLTDNGRREHHNMIETSQGIEWICGLESIFAVERNGEMEMMDGLVLLKEKTEAPTVQKSSFEIVSELPSAYVLANLDKQPEFKLPEKGKTVPNQAVVMKIGKQEGRNIKKLAAGDTVIAEMRFAQQYNFSGILGDTVYVLDVKRIMMKIA